MRHVVLAAALALLPAAAFAQANDNTPSSQPPGVTGTAPSAGTQTTRPRRRQSSHQQSTMGHTQTARRTARARNTQRQPSQTQTQPQPQPPGGSTE